MILMGRIVGKLHPEKGAVIQWHTQAGNITNDHKVKVYFTSPALSTMNVMTWKCHMDDSAKGSYNMTLGQYIYT